MHKAAHVYRRGTTMPSAHATAVMSAPWMGPYVVLYHDGQWREWGGGYNLPAPAIADATWLSAGGTVHDHT